MSMTRRKCAGLARMTMTFSTLPTHLKNTSEAVKREKNKIMTAMLVWLKGYVPTREHKIPDTSSDTQWVRNQEPQYPTSPRPANRAIAMADQKNKSESQLSQTPAATPCG